MTIHLSKKGMKELKKQIAHLERDQQYILSELRNLDKTDGHEQRLARIEKLAQLEQVENDLFDKKQILTHAKLLPRKRDALKVAIGSVVELIDTQGRLFRYTLVDSIEANPSDGRISVQSPLGMSLINKQLKDVIEWTASFGTRQLRLIKIQ